MLLSRWRSDRRAHTSQKVQPSDGDQLRIVTRQLGTLRLGNNLGIRYFFSFFSSSSCAQYGCMSSVCDLALVGRGRTAQGDPTYDVVAKDSMLGGVEEEDGQHNI